MLFWKPEVVQKASPVQRPYGQAAGDVVLSCEKWLPAVILGKKEQLSDLPHLASCGTWLSCKNPWSCKHFGATGMGQGLRASREPVGGRIWLGAPTVTWHSWCYRASSRCAALAELELSNYREVSIWSGLLLVWLILLNTALLMTLCFPHLAWGGDGQLPVGAHCFSELIWEGLIQFSDKCGESFHWFQWLLEWSRIA